MLLQLDETAFRQLFSSSPVKRIGRDRFIRNVLVAAGNSDDKTLSPHIKPHLSDPSSLVRGMAIWALAQLLPTQEFAILRQQLASQEINDNIKREWKADI
ncbi:MAG: epoxyqueuosine reductase [Candidatus Tokpelaia sp. JSC189]|nr:MAG: epoxyqueuosine reductase [Candidatus Tokpelaia sp. JSC189]